MCNKFNAQQEGRAGKIKIITAENINLIRASGAITSAKEKSFRRRKYRNCHNGSQVSKCGNSSQDISCRCNNVPLKTNSSSLLWLFQVNFVDSTFTLRVYSSHYQQESTSTSALNSNIIKTNSNFVLRSSVTTAQTLHQQLRTFTWLQYYLRKAYQDRRQTSTTAKRPVDWR